MSRDSKDIIDHKEINRLNQAIDQTNKSLDQIINKKSKKHRFNKQNLVIFRFLAFTSIIFMYFNLWHNDFNDKIVFEFLSLIGFFTLLFLIVLK